MATFTGKRYTTMGVQNEIPIGVQIMMWAMIDEDRQLKKDLDYLQVFELKSLYENGRYIQQVIHSQEQPRRRKSRVIDTDSTVSAKIFVIDDISHVTMLLNSEY